MDLFSITCTTCKTRLKVREQAAIGQILACPKCGGMVMVKPPHNWSAGSAENAELPTATEVVANVPQMNQTIHNSAFEALDDLLSDAPPKMRPPPGASGPASQAAPPAAGPASPASTTPSSASPPSAGTAANKPRFIEGPRAASPAPRPRSNATPSPASSEPKSNLSNGASASAASAAGQMNGVPTNGTSVKGPAENAVPPPPPTSEYEAAAAPPQTASLLRFWLLTGASVVVGGALAFVAVTAAIRLLRGPSVAQPIAKGTSPAQLPAESKDGVPAPNLDPALSPADTAASPSPESPAETPPKSESPPVAQVLAPAESPPGAPPTAATDPVGIVTPLPPGAAKSPATDSPATGSLAKFDRLLTDEDPLAKQTAGQPAAEAPLPPVEDGAPVRPIAPRPPPREIDVAKRLADPLLGIETAGTPLADFLQLVSDFSTIPITLETDALPIVNALATTPVVVNATNLSVKGALAAALKPLRLEAIEADGQLIVRAAEPASPATLNFPVKDLAPDEESMVALAELLKALVDPASWGESPEQPAMTIDAMKGTIAVRHSRSAHAQLLLLCEKLRTARGLKPQSRIDPAFFAIDTRAARAHARLETPLSLTYSQPTRLLTVLDRLSELGGVRILVDWRDVAAAGWNPAGEATLVVSQQPLSAALDALLAPLDLTWRIIDGQTLQVVTPARLAEQTEIELHKVGDLLANDPTGEALLGKIRTALGDVTFRSGGGNGEIRYDETSQSLLASLPQPKQRELEALLAQWRSQANK